MKKLRVLVCMVLVAMAPCDLKADANQDAKDLAAKLNSLYESQSKGPNSKVAQDAKKLDSRAVSSEEEARAVEASRYYDSKEELQDIAMQKSLDTDLDASGGSGQEGIKVGQTIRSGRKTRPKFEIDQTNHPALQMERDIGAKAEAFVNSSDGECVDLPFNETASDVQTETCKVLGFREDFFRCDSKLEVECANEDVGNQLEFTRSDIKFSGNPMWIESRGNNTFRIINNIPGGGNCSRFQAHAVFNVDDKKDIDRFFFHNITYDDWFQIKVNGHSVFHAIGGRTGRRLSEEGARCEHGRWFSGPKEIDAKEYLQNGENIIEIRNLVHRGGGTQVRFSIFGQKKCDEVETIERRCEDGRTHIGSKLRSKKCLDKNRSKNINGIRVFKGCWSWDELYHNESNLKYERQRKCTELEEKGCYQTSSKCLEKEDQDCMMHEYTYECSKPAKKNVSLCRKSLTCPDGDCAEELKNQGYSDDTTQFNKAMTGMSLAKEISKEFESASISLFKGDHMSCGATAAGLHHCCKDSSFFVKNGLSNCSKEEMKLAAEKDAGKNFHIGNYKEGKILKKEFESHCVYASKLARILIVNGRSQLGLGFGSPREPDCRGLSVEQIEEIDFSEIDFSEFVSDAMAMGAQGEAEVKGAVADLAEKMKNKFGGD